MSRRAAPINSLQDGWALLNPRWLPFADAATAELPLRRILRLSLFQVSAGMALVLLAGTLNRVMIVELGVSAALVAAMLALPILFAPFRALIGFRSDTHRSVLGWRRVPYIWIGTLLQFGGLAIMPFALLVLSADPLHGPEFARPIGAALAFLLVGAGLHTTQTAGLALATDLAPEESRPRVVALLYVMLLVGMVGSSLLFGFFLQDFAQTRLIQVIQGAAVVTLVLNTVALWKQEARRPNLTLEERPRPRFAQAWAGLSAQPDAKRLLVAVGLGAAGFSMQDILLEPYGGEILGLSVASTTALTALFAGGTLAGFALAARHLTQGMNPHRLAAYGALIGAFAFAIVIFAGPLGSALLFQLGTVLIGFGSGLFLVGTLTAAMNLADTVQSGLALGAWGAVQATAAGAAIAAGGAIRDLVAALADRGVLGPAITDPSAGYSAVYHIEIVLLFAAIVAIGPLARFTGSPRPPRPTTKFGLAEFPG